MVKKYVSKQVKISGVELTDEKLTGRGGIHFFLRFVENIGFYSLFEKYFSFAKLSKKGLGCYQFIKQLLAFFGDGTDMSMSGFGRRKNDPAFAALLENTSDQMASSHQMKRFFEKFTFIGNCLYRAVLLQLFIWRLKIE